MSLRKDVLRLTFPIFLEMLFVTLMGATDTFMLSQYSDEAVAAVGVANQIITFAFLIFQIINIGTTVLCSQFLGAGDRKKMEQVTAMALLLNIVSGAIISTILSCGAPTLLDWMGLDTNLKRYGVPYMHIAGSFAFFQALHLTVSASLRADHKVMYPMMVAFAANIVNVIGNYMLIMGHWGCPALGAEGAAIATSISRGTVAVLMFGILFAKHIPFKNLIYAFRTPVKDLCHVMRDLLKIGLPSAGENMSYDAQQITLTYFINIIGTAELATRSYVCNIALFAYIFSICIAQGGGIVMAHLIGQHHYEACYKLGWYVLQRAVMITVGMSCIFALFGRAIFTTITDNTEIITLGCTVLLIDVLVEVGKATNIYYVAVLRSVGDTNFPFYVGITIQWIVGVLCGWLFGIYFGWGLVGIWCSFILDEGIRGGIFVWRWYSKRWQQRSFV